MGFDLGGIVDVAAKALGGGGGGGDGIGNLVGVAKDVIGAIGGGKENKVAKSDAGRGAESVRTAGAGSSDAAAGASSIAAAAPAPTGITVSDAAPTGNDVKADAAKQLAAGKEFDDTLTSMLVAQGDVPVGLAATLEGASSVAEVQQLLAGNPKLTAFAAEHGMTEQEAGDMIVEVAAGIEDTAQVVAAVRQTDSKATSA